MTLSPRETEALRALAGGLLQKQIARRLDVSLYTVKDHLRLCRLKLGAKTNTQAAVIAQSMGILRDESAAVQHHKGKE